MTSLLAKLHDRSAKVVVVGQGYVGLPVAVRATHVGYSVVGLDSSAERVKSLQSGESYVGDISHAELRTALQSGYVATTEIRDCSGFDVAVVSVPRRCLSDPRWVKVVAGAGNYVASAPDPSSYRDIAGSTGPSFTGLSGKIRRG